MHGNDAPDWALEQIENARKTHARTLNLSGYRQKKQLTRIPPDVFTLTHLQELDLYANKIQSISTDITRLTNLQILNLSSNRLTAVPDAISDLHNLQIIDLGGNRVQKIPAWLVNLPRLDTLYLHGSPVWEPQSSIINMKGPRGKADLYKLRAYYRGLAKGEDVLYEAKLIVVGEPGAGKTTLAKKLQDPNYQLVDEPTTEGIDIFPWVFVRMPIGQTVEIRYKVNIWDFGGHEIDYATHRFFLTKDSLYVIVADARERKTYFYDWLYMVGLFSSESPTFIVVNEKKDRKWDIDEQLLKKEFNNFKEVLRVNLAHKNLDSLVEEIQHRITTLSPMGKKLPKSWISVREALEAKAKTRNTISLPEYLDICKQNGFEQEGDTLELIDYLTKIGVCLYFQEHVKLRNSLFLNPEWVTDAAYKVLNDRQVQENHGRFTDNDLIRIWYEEAYTEKRFELLELMKRFQLCYQLPATINSPDAIKSYILPQLLEDKPPRQIGDEWDKDNQNQIFLRYRYPEFMPRGILTRLIVAMHEQIAKVDEYGPDLVWRTGVVLVQKGARARVVEHHYQRKLEIQITGNRKRDLLTIITWELGRIHKTFPKLNYKMDVPCNCSKCKKSTSPYLHHFEDLERRMEQRKYYFDCNNSFERIDVRSLLEGVNLEQPFIPDDEYFEVFNESKLFVMLANHFDISELRTLSFSIRIDFDDLHGQTSSDKARELILFCKRHHRISALIKAICKARPLLCEQLNRL